MENNYLLLIDGSSLLSTQFFGNLPREILFSKTPEEKEKYYHKIMMTSKGVYTNAVFGFMRTLLKIIREQKPAYLAVAWDMTRDTFRREMYADYKGNRSETMEPLKKQFELCQEVLKKIGVAEFMDPYFEADDFCGSIASKFEGTLPVRIFTKDNDYLQLVTEQTHLWLMHASQDKTDELFKKYKIDKNSLNIPDRAFELTPELVEAEFGVKPESIPSLKGLMGDSSDNIKGVPGVGPQTAVKLIQAYGNVSALYEAIRDLDDKGKEAIKKEWKEKYAITRSPLNFLLKTSDEELCGEASAVLSEKLAVIRRDIDLSNVTLSDLETKIDQEALLSVFNELEFNSLKAEFMKEEKPKIDRTEAFTLCQDMTIFETSIRSIKNKTAVGLYYREHYGMSLSFPDGNTFAVFENFFIDRAILKNLALSVFSKAGTVYTTDGKALIKLCGETARDVTLSAYLMDPLKGEYPYMAIAETILHENFPAPDPVIGKEDPDEVKFKFSDSLRDALCFEALTACMGGPLLDQKLAENSMLSLYEEIELPVMGTLARMEETGIAVKKEALKAYGEALTKRIDTLEKSIWNAAGEHFNINSPKQLGEVLFEKMNLPYGKKARGSYSTAADILEKLAPEYPVVRDILEYRTYTKLKSTYAEGLYKFISSDGRIHGTFNQTITATGRLSSTNPNLQNIPVRIDLGRQIRKVFVPKDGCIFIDADYSQIELRILAHLSDDANLIAAYRQAKDIHAITASQVFGVPLSEVTPTLRSNAKAVNFGIVYGISAFSLSEDLAISRAEAKEYMDNYFRTYPGIEKYLNDTVKEAKDRGFVTTMYGRIRPIPELMSVNFNQRAFGERVAMNSPIQGTAADIMKIAMIRVEKALLDHGLKSKIVLQIHDELLIEAYEEEADEVEKLLTKEMSAAAELKVALETEAKRGINWYETK